MNQLILTTLLLVAGASANADINMISPDPRLTPGVFNDPPTPLETLCQPGHTKQVRHVTQATKMEVFREYGFVFGQFKRNEYEIDHLIPLSLDGTNDTKNLWPESYVTTGLNAHTKDVLEDTLHHLVCSKELDLAIAQREIATDWVSAYAHYVSHQAQKDLTNR